jgi:hypothetical protein
MIPGAALSMRDAINEIRALSIAEMERRGKVATGRTMSTLSTVVTETPGFVTGELQGESQWRFVGNGRGPGGKPPTGKIIEWLRVKGIGQGSGIPWPLVNYIRTQMAEKGSKDFREKKTNVFLSAIDDWEQKGGLAKTAEDVAGHFEQQVVTATIKGFERT